MAELKQYAAEPMAEVPEMKELIDKKMKEMAELKPIERCPFCGGFGNLCQAENKVYEDVPKYLWFVKCDNKLCAIKPITPLYATKEQAIDAWNKRS